MSKKMNLLENINVSQRDKLQSMEKIKRETSNNIS